MNLSFDAVKPHIRKSSFVNMSEIIRFIKTHHLAILLGIFTMLSAWLRSFEMNSGLGVDEILTHMGASQGLLVAFNHSVYPLYYVLCHFALLLGDSEAIVRLPSYLAGIASIPLMYYMGLIWHGKRAGIISALLLMLSSTHIYYSQMARFYSFVALAAIIVLAATGLLIKKPDKTKNWILFGCGSLLGIASHPFFIPFLFWVAAILIVILLLNFKKQRQVILSYATGCVAIVALLTSFLYYGKLEQVDHFVGGQLNVKLYALALEQYYDYWKELLYLQDPEIGRRMCALLIAGSIFFWLRRRLSSLPIILVPILFPIPLMLIPSSHVYQGRYFISMLPGSLFLVAVFFVDFSEMIARFTHRFAVRLKPGALYQNISAATLEKIFLSGIVGLFIVFYYGQNLNGNHRRDKWKYYVELMAPYLSNHDVIIHYAPYPLASPDTWTSEMPFDYAMQFYLHRFFPQGRKDLLPARIFSTIKKADIQKLIHQYPDKNIWVIHWRSNPILRMTPAQDKLFNTLAIGWMEILLGVGAPSTNLLVGGDMETSQLPAQQVTGNVNIVTDKSDSSRFARFSVIDENPTATLTFRVNRDNNLSSATVAKSLLDPSKDYVLSFRYKHSYNSGRSMRLPGSLINIKYSINGQQHSIPLCSLYWSQDWKFQSVPLKPDMYPQLFTADNISFQFSHAGKTADLCIDNIQFEAGTHPTPYTNGTRPPHDQALAQIEAALHER